MVFALILQCDSEFVCCFCDAATRLIVLTQIKQLFLLAQIHDRIQIHYIKTIAYSFHSNVDSCFCIQIVGIIFYMMCNCGI